MTTLAEFLLDRIDEDAIMAASGWGHEPDGRWTRFNEGNAVLTPSAVLAECEAKRRIVESIRYDFERETAGWHSAQSLMHLLALPYSDHPDFREEWRPDTPS